MLFFKNLLLFKNGHNFNEYFLNCVLLRIAGKSNQVLSQIQRCETKHVQLKLVYMYDCK